MDTKNSSDWGAETPYSTRNKVAAHPSTSPRPRFGRHPEVGYQPLQGALAHADALVWPRATVRPVHGLAPGETIWCAKIWHSPAVPMLVDRKWVSFTSHDAPTVFRWAEGTVAELRAVQRFTSAEVLGYYQKSWRPQW